MLLSRISRQLWLFRLLWVHFVGALLTEALTLQEMAALDAKAREVGTASSQTAASEARSSAETITGTAPQSLSLVSFRKAGGEGGESVTERVRDFFTGIF